MIRKNADIRIKKIVIIIVILVLRLHLVRILRIIRVLDLYRRRFVALTRPDSIFDKNLFRKRNFDDKRLEKEPWPLAFSAKSDDEA